MSSTEWPSTTDDHLGNPRRLGQDIMEDTHPASQGALSDNVCKRAFRIHLIRHSSPSMIFRETSEEYTDVTVA